MNSGCRVLKATAHHANIAIALIEEYYDAIGVIARDSPAAIRRMLSAPDGGIWLGYQAEDPVGCILLRPLAHLAYAGEIKRLYVKANVRGTGIAGLLLNALEEFAKAHSIRHLYLDTHDKLTVAIRFYERHGYQRCERYNDNPQATIFMMKNLEPETLIRPFETTDAEAFRLLNEAWIKKHFVLEPADQEVLCNPQRYIIEAGGYIAMAVRGSEPVGCCALLKMSEHEYEVAKMTVADGSRGLGIGRKLLVHVIDAARQRHATRLYLGSNSKLTDALHLYESVGFTHIPHDAVARSPYKRADVHMEMQLSAPLPR